MAAYTRLGRRVSGRGVDEAVSLRAWPKLRLVDYVLGEWGVARRRRVFLVDG